MFNFNSFILGKKSNCITIFEISEIVSIFVNNSEFKHPKLCTFLPTVVDMNFHFGSAYLFTVNENFLFSSTKNLNKHSRYPLSLRSLGSSWGDIKASFSHALHPVQSAGPTESIQRDRVKCKCCVISVLNISQRTLSHSKWKMSSRYQQWGGLYECDREGSKVGVPTWCSSWLSVAVIRRW